MKKIMKLVLTLICVLALTGCNNRTMDDIVETESTQNTETTETTETKTTVSGSFTVQVRDVIPDYCLDDTTPNVAVVTEFQSYPFTLYVGEEIGRQLEVGEVYVFTIKPVEVDCAKEDLEGMSLSSLVWELPGMEITDFRLAEEDEIGLDSLSLIIE